MMHSSHGPRSRSRDKNASTVGSPDRAPLLTVEPNDDGFDPSLPRTPRSPRSPRRGGQRNGIVRKGLVCSIFIVAATVIFCLYVDKENILRLAERSNSLIRKKGENLSRPLAPGLEGEIEVTDAGTVVDEEVTENVERVDNYSSESQLDTNVQDGEMISDETFDENAGHESDETVGEDMDSEEAIGEDVESVEKQPENDNDTGNEEAPSTVVTESAPNNDEEDETVIYEMTSTDVDAQVAQLKNTAVTKQNTEVSVVEVIDTRPNLVLHIGPQKTGSTTLQEAWASANELYHTLEEDHYSYHFINPHRGFFDCDVISGGYYNCKSTEMIKNTISEAKSRHNHLLMSDENLDERFVAPLREVIDDADWNVKVVVVYRRIHEWLVSWYNQINKSTNKDAKGGFLIDEHGNPYREQHTHWPEDGGQHVPTFSAWYKSFTAAFKKTDLISHHNSVSFMRAYKEVFDNVVVYNMHEEGDLVTNFMCNVVPDATKCCNQLRGGVVKVPRANGSINLDYDIIAVEAKERGLLMNGISRKAAVAEVTNYVQLFNPTIPRRCDSNVIDEIRSWLVDSEAYMFSDSWTDAKNDDLCEVFESYLDKGLLCDVDLDVIFADPNWIAFFEAHHNPASEKRKNHLVLHVGPQKTGSSTLQAAWDIMYRNSMDRDNYNYKHITPEDHDFSCDVGPWGGFKSCEASESLKTLIKSTAKAGRNLLLSDENLDDRFAATLRGVIDDDQWIVTVVVVYRRIHEWLVSWYNQIHKTTNLDSKGNVLIDKNGNPYRQEHVHWPSQGGRRVPLFSEWYFEFIYYWDQTKLVEKHRSVDFYNIYAKLFDDVIVYDMHADGDLVTNFMCEIIPQADHSCIQLQEHKIALPTVNPSVNLDHDILAVAAHEQGYIHGKITRREAVDAVAKHVKATGKKLPQKCNDSIINQMYDWLERSEKYMFADEWTEERNAAMNESFQTDLAKGKLCDVDVEEIFKDEEWIHFFNSVGKW
jgi:hypothetical protein